MLSLSIFDFMPNNYVPENLFPTLSNGCGTSFLTQRNSSERAREVFMDNYQHQTGEEHSTLWTSSAKETSLTFPLSRLLFPEL
jgi:hypothetical protein